MLDTSKGLICIFFFELRNSEVNDAVGKKAGKTIANDQEGSMWIGIHTDSNITTNSTERDFFLSQWRALH